MPSIELADCEELETKDVAEADTSTNEVTDIASDSSHEEGDTE